MAPKVLIVCEKMGMGHERMASIVRGIIEADTGAEVLTVAGSDMLGAASARWATDLWNFLIRKNWIAAADCLLNRFARTVFLPIAEVLDTQALLAKVAEADPDLIVCTADVYNKVLGTYAAANGIPFFIFIVDFAVFQDLVNPAAVHMCYTREVVDAVRAFDLSTTYFSRPLNGSTSVLQKARYVLGYLWDHVLHPRTRPIFHPAGASAAEPNGAKCVVMGPLAEKKHFQPRDIPAVRRRLGIPDEHGTILIASGSIGGRFLLDTVDLICATCREPANLLVMCGRDEVLYRQMQSRMQESQAIRILPFPFVDNFDDFLAVADCAITRGTAGVFTEGLVHRTIPILYGRVPLNDSGTRTVIERHGLGEVCMAKRGLVPAIERVLRDKERYLQNIDAFLAPYPATYEEMARIIAGELRRALPPARAPLAQPASR